MVMGLSELRSGSRAEMAERQSSLDCQECRAALSTKKRLEHASVAEYNQQTLRQAILLWGDIGVSSMMHLLVSVSHS